MTRHHPACPVGAHIHTQASGAYVVWLDDVWLALMTDRATAERVAALINAHGLADVPDHIPDPPTPQPKHRRTSDERQEWQVARRSHQQGRRRRDV